MDMVRSKPYLIASALLFLLAASCGDSEARPGSDSRPTPPTLAAPAGKSLTAEQVIQRAGERFARVGSYRGELTVTLEPSRVPFMRSVADVHVGRGAATTMELMDPRIGRATMRPHLIAVGEELYLKLQPQDAWVTVPAPNKSRTFNQLQAALGGDFRGAFGEPVPLFESLARLGATFTSAVDPDFEDGEAYRIDFAVRSEQLKESMLMMLREEGQELSEEEERLAEFKMSGSVWVTTADLLVRRHEVLLTSLPAGLLLGRARRVEGRFAAYDEPVSIKRPSSVERPADGGTALASGSTEAVDPAGAPATLEPAWFTTFGGPGGDEAWSALQTADGGYVVAGVTESYGAGGRDVYLIKAGADGSEQWSKTFGESGVDWGYSVQQTADGGYVVTGKSDPAGGGGGDVYLIKTDGGGDEQWSSSFGGPGWDGAYAVRQTSDGGYVVAGKTESYGSGDADAYLIKTDEEGKERWSKFFGGPDADWASSVIQAADGGYVLAGVTRSFGEGVRNVYLVKTDQKGDEEWSRTFGDQQTTVVWWVWSAQQTSDGGYVIAFVAGGDAYLLKTDGQGREQWRRSFGGEMADGAWSVQQTSDGGYVVAGDTESYGAGGTDVYLVKTDSEGVEQWSSTFGGPRDEFAWSIRQTADGGYVVAGKTDSYGVGGGDVLLIKTNGAGGAAAGRAP